MIAFFFFVFCFLFIFQLPQAQKVNSFPSLSSHPQNSRVVHVFTALCPQPWLWPVKWFSSYNFRSLELERSRMAHRVSCPLSPCQASSTKEPLVASDLGANLCPTTLLRILKWVKGKFAHSFREHPRSSLGYFPRETQWPSLSPGLWSQISENSPWVLLIAKINSSFSCLTTRTTQRALEQSSCQWPDPFTGPHCLSEMIWFPHLECSLSRKIPYGCGAGFAVLSPMACHCILRTVMAEKKACDAYCISFVYFPNMQDFQKTQYFLVTRRGMVLFQELR